jgi:hypothetical protein
MRLARTFAVLAVALSILAAGRAHAASIDLAASSLGGAEVLDLSAPGGLAFSLLLKSGSAIELAVVLAPSETASPLGLIASLVSLGNLPLSRVAISTVGAPGVALGAIGFRATAVLQSQRPRRRRDASRCRSTRSACTCSRSARPPRTAPSRGRSTRAVSGRRFRLRIGRSGAGRSWLRSRPLARSHRSRATPVARRTAGISLCVQRQRVRRAVARRSDGAVGSPRAAPSCRTATDQFSVSLVERPTQ